MMKEVKVSVIVPVYKAEEYLPRCIDSILAQTYSNFELLLVDDGSPDNSGKICDEYAIKDSRIRVFHKENGGVSSARNVGLDKAEGDWIMFCDADDEVEPIILRELLEKEKQSDLVIGGYKSFGDSTAVETFSSIIITHQDNVDLLKFYMQATTFKVVWGKLYKTSIIRQNNICFNTIQKIGEDTSFLWEYMAFCERISIVDAIVYKYYVYGTFLKKYHLSFKSMHEHLSVLQSKVETIERNWNSKFTVLTQFSKQLYYGLFLKHILINNTLKEYVNERGMFIHAFGKEKNIKVSFISDCGWRLFLGNSITAVFLYYLIRLKYIFNFKKQ